MIVNTAIHQSNQFAIGMLKLHNPDFKAVEFDRFSEILEALMKLLSNKTKNFYAF